MEKLCELSETVFTLRFYQWQRVVSRACLRIKLGVRISEDQIIRAMLCAPYFGKIWYSVFQNVALQDNIVLKCGQFIYHQDVFEVFDLKRFAAHVKDLL